MRVIVCLQKLLAVCHTQRCFQMSSRCWSRRVFGASLRSLHCATLRWSLYRAVSHSVASDRTWLVDLLGTFNREIAREQNCAWFLTSAQRSSQCIFARVIIYRYLCQFCLHHQVVAAFLHCWVSGASLAASSSLSHPTLSRFPAWFLTFSLSALGSFILWMFFWERRPVFRLSF